MHLAGEVPEFCEETLRQVAGDGQKYGGDIFSHLSVNYQYSICSMAMMLPALVDG